MNNVEKICYLSGGLGNCFFMYCLYLKFKSLGFDAKLCTKFFHSAVPKGTIKRYNDIKLIAKVYDEISSVDYHKIKKKFRNYSEEMFDNEPCVVYNTFEHHDTIVEMKDKLIDSLDFKLPEENQDLNKEILDEINNTESVSIHIRRTDYLNPENIKNLGSVATEEYYQSALKYIKDHVENPNFFVFTDDPEYCKLLYPFKVIDWNQNAGYYDLYLMSKCKHNIRAYSTFSKWASILNTNKDKIIIGVNKTYVNKDKLFCNVLFDSSGNELTEE